MKNEKIAFVQKQLIAEFLENIGVAWFAAGVIGVFVSGTKNMFDIGISITWGIVLSVIFLWGGVNVIKAKL